MISKVANTGFEAGLEFVLYLERGKEKPELSVEVVWERKHSYRTATVEHVAIHSNIKVFACLIRRSHHLLLTGRQRLQSFQVSRMEVMTSVILWIYFKEKLTDGREDSLGISRQ